MKQVLRVADRPHKQIAAATLWHFAVTAHRVTQREKRRRQLPILRHRTRSIPVALVATWFLALQSLLGAFALGNAAPAGQLDIFGNVLCTQDGAKALPGSDPHRQSLPPCCNAGCVLSGATFTPPTPTSATAPSVNFENVAYVAHRPAPVRAARERSTANPRAPPLAV